MYLLQKWVLAFLSKHYWWKYLEDFSESVYNDLVWCVFFDVGFWTILNPKSSRKSFYFSDLFVSDFRSLFRDLYCNSDHKTKVCFIFLYVKLWRYETERKMSWRGFNPENLNPFKISKLSVFWGKKAHF